MAGKFEVFKDKAGQFRFRLKSGNGEIVLASEGYKDRSGAMNGIKSVQKNATEPKRFVKKVAASGKHHFVLRAGNNQVIGSSEMYDAELSCDNGIKSVMSCVAGAAVDDQSAA